MSKWEKQVKVSLDDLFDEESDGTNTNEEVVEEVIEDDGSQSSHFSDVEVEDIISRGIILILAEEYHGETGKKPIWKNKITNVFKKWLKDKYPEAPEDFKEVVPKEVVPKEKIVPKEKTAITGKELSKAMIYFNHIKFLYELMSEKTDFTVDPTEEDIEYITKIDKLIKGE